MYRLVRLNGKNIAQNAAFLRSELSLKLTGVHHRLTLFWWVIAQIAKGLFHQPLPVRRQGMEFLHRSAHLLPHLRAQVLHGLNAVHCTLTLFWRHTVDLPQPVEELLLRLRGEPVEAWFALQGSFLLFGSQVSVPLQPRPQVCLLVVFKSWAGNLLLSRPGETWSSPYG